jgi:T-complex protein 1 subunit beta
VTVLCGELLREAEFLVNQRVHPMTIVQGWRLAVQIARSALEQAAVDNSADQARFKEDLMNIARTTLSSKLLNVEKDHFAGLAVEAVLRLKGSGNLDYIQVRLLGSVTCGTAKLFRGSVFADCCARACVRVLVCDVLWTFTL